MPSALPIAAACVLGVLGTTLKAAGPPGRVSFERDVAPLFRSACIGCHSGSDAKGGLDLTTTRTAMARGDDGPRIVSRPPRRQPLA